MPPLLPSRPIRYPVPPGDILAVIGRGPLGSAWRETYQLTALPFGARKPRHYRRLLHGVSTGGVSASGAVEGPAGGPIGRGAQGDTIQITVDTINLQGVNDLVGHDGRSHARRRPLCWRAAPNLLMADERLPDDTRQPSCRALHGGASWLRLRRGPYHRTAGGGVSGVGEERRHSPCRRLFAVDSSFTHTPEGFDMPTLAKRN